MARSLKPFFDPASVAIVGASERLTSSGGAVLRNMQIGGYRGQLIPVNPKAETVLGLPAKRSLRELTPPAELVVVVVAPPAIVDVVREGAESGHKNFLILPGGFAEAGEEGRQRDRELRALAAAHGLTIAGPNCAGIINLLDKGNACAPTFLRDLPKGGGVAFLSQSGAIAEELIEKSHRLGIPLGAVVSIGNAMHLHVDDYFGQLADDPRCSVVLIYLESVEDPERFKREARALAARKPLVALIGGRTEPGSRASRAHTGGSGWTEAQIERFCEECGILRVTSLRQLMLAGKGFGRYPQGFGPRVLLLSNSGGPGVLATDAAAAAGLDLAPLPAALAARLKAFLPPEASVANPLDLLADAREERFGKTFQAVMEVAADAYDAVLMIHVVPFMVDAAPVIERLASLSANAPLPLFHSMMGTLEAREAWFERMEQAGVPMFNDVEEMAWTAGALARYPAIRERLAS
ncbi:MAG TPA: CoA-binding protein [Burkholderiales bacterium]